MASDAEWKKRWASSQLSKCKLSELKDYLKSVGLPMAGDQTMVVKRVGMHLDVKHLDLFVLQEGKKTSPFDLKQPNLRKIVAQLGMDPTGDKDELHSSLIEHLKKKSVNKSSSGAGGGESSEAGASDESKGVLMAKQIIEMKDDYPSILSTSGINITTDSSVSSMRKAYLKLSLFIHPDKLQRAFPDATKAFQCLVNAYERLSQPELFMEEDEEPEKKTRVKRSNDGCYRTRIFCPRCKSEWGLPDSGTMDYDYNFMMMGLKTFNCALCLLEFGCMTGVQKCPSCNKEFDYHPNDYHRKVSCGNAKCKSVFGFYEFKISDRVEKEYRQEVRRKQEKQLKEKEQLAGRAKRANSRQTAIGPQGKNKLFVLNLLDNCPQCGDEVESNQELREEHLASCNDKKKIAAYAKQLKDDEEKMAKKRKLKEQEEEVTNAQSWDYLGGKTTDLWLLTETQVRNLCENYRLDSTGTKDEMIARVAHYRNALDSKRMITAAGEVGSSKKKKLSVEDLPTNMESMTVPQLKAVCASFGVVTGAKFKAGIINDIEKACHGDEPFLRITDGKNKKK